MSCLYFYPHFSVLSLRWFRTFHLSWFYYICLNFSSKSLLCNQYPGQLLVCAPVCPPVCSPAHPSVLWGTSEMTKVGQSLFKRKAAFFCLCRNRLSLCSKAVFHHSTMWPMYYRYFFHNCVVYFFLHFSFFVLLMGETRWWMVISSNTGK